MKPNTRCRICRGTKLRTFLDLGSQPLANAFVRREDLIGPEAAYPLAVAFCADCNLCQLTHVVEPEALFRRYVYFSSRMPGQEHFERYARDVIRTFLSNPGNDLVVEIGSNDGHLLRMFQRAGVRTLGIDPAENVVQVANANGIETIPAFFSAALAERLAEKYGRAAAIIGNNVVAHIDDYRDLLAGISRLLMRDGVFALEAPYLTDMIERRTFDTVYHEHLSYLAVRPLTRLFREFGMEIFDVQVVPVQGKSLRIFAGRTGAHPVRPSLPRVIEREEQLRLRDFTTYETFAARIGETKEDVMRLLRALKAKGKRIAGYGAPAKGNTLLNYYGIGPEILEFVTEELPSKIGSCTPGTHIPVVDIREARMHPPDYYLLLAWNYKDAVLAKERLFLERGGTFIMPVGTERII